MGRHLPVFGLLLEMRHEVLTDSDNNASADLPLYAYFYAEPPCGFIVLQFERAQRVNKSTINILIWNRASRGTSCQEERAPRVTIRISSFSWASF